MSKTDSITAAKARDLACSAAKREYDFVCSRFLSPSEQIAYFSAIRETDPAMSSRCFFYGGAAGADRRLCIIAPSYIDVSDSPKSVSVFDTYKEHCFITLAETYAPEESFGIVPLEVRGSGFASLSHRDYMGSILALGIEREVIGDIAVTSERSAVIFTSEVISPFICQNLTKIGRDGVSVTPTSIPRNYVIPRNFENMTVIAASDRADSIVAALTGVSRADAKEYCVSGIVDINYVTVSQPDERVVPGDIISVRGYGKFIIDSFDGETRSGRARISVRKYA